MAEAPTLQGPSAHAMLSRAQAGYELDPGAGGCGKCRWSVQGHCAVVVSEVKPYNCCDFWNVAHPPTGIGKERAGFIECKPGADLLCYDCEFSQAPRASRCAIVKGPIRPQDTCGKYEPADVVGPAAKRKWGLPESLGLHKPHATTGTRPRG